MAVSIFTLVIYSLYVLASCSLLLYGLNAWLLLILRLINYKTPLIKNQKYPWDSNQSDSWPYVTVQIPLYNERNVAERVIRAVAGLEWPKNRLEIQVLDDSIDDTKEVVDRVVAELKQQSIDIHVIRRSERTGFKAGALAYGIEVAKGEYFAIFDADFTPMPDFLIKMMPEFFEEPNVGFVQARWGHLNRDENLYTQCQALGIDGHFLIEQPARYATGLFMNFNGSAGIWLKRAILECGGWQSETLTEDLDLSYRVLLAGFKARYRDDVIVPAEIPATITAAKSQQFRWAKGSIQTAIKVLPKVFKQPSGFFKKAEAFLHITNYAVHPLMFLIALLAFPIIAFFRVSVSPDFWFWALIPILAATLGPSSMYIAAMLLSPERKLRHLPWLPFLIVYGTGIAISNSLAVWEALTGRPSAFIRTPKKGDNVLSGYRLRRNRVWSFEILLGLYSVGSIIASIQNDMLGTVPYMFIFAIGFLLSGLKTYRELGGDS